MSEQTGWLNFLPVTFYHISREIFVFDVSFLSLKQNGGRWIIKRDLPHQWIIKQGLYVVWALNSARAQLASSLELEHYLTLKWLPKWIFPFAYCNGNAFYYFSLFPWRSFVTNERWFPYESVSIKVHWFLTCSEFKWMRDKNR